ncbi:MAG: NAD-dependent dehydratase [Planctomycetota bacterium]|nr:MAG: NAD-dependent dehydratase [Planctomycetota bacterium]
MKVLVTGHDGYIGTVLVPIFEAAGHEVHGLDSFLFHDCVFGEDRPGPRNSIAIDVRDLKAEQLAGFDAIVHLAGLSNDPLGNLDPQLTFDINHKASVRLAELAKNSGVRRFVFSSSCSNYGAGGEDYLDESSALHPVTPYGESKVLAEADLEPLNSPEFCVTCLRNATAFGVSPRLRGDLVLNNLVGLAVSTGQVLMKSDGSPWRPLVHIADIAQAFLRVIEAPEDKVRGQAFNVGRSDENYRIREIAEIVAEVVPNCRVEYEEGAGPDKRCYRVNCDKIREALPDFVPQWTVRTGVEEVYAAFLKQGLSSMDFVRGPYLRIRHVQELMEQGRIDASLRWCEGQGHAI